VTVPGHGAWAGLRGGVYLAALLARQRGINDGVLFPQHDRIIVLNFTVILATLVGQGPTVQSLLRRLVVGMDEPSARRHRPAEGGPSIAIATRRACPRATAGLVW
jgi:CPA1 family monovalent cation:H+ antiporter